VRRVLLALAMLAGAPALGAEVGEVRAEATLHLLATDLERLPPTQVLFDASSGTFDLAPYLDTRGADRYLSTIAGLRLEGRHLGGALRWTLAADTGELRRASVPSLATLCPVLATRSPSGTALASAGGCLTAGRWSVPLKSQDHPEVLSNGRPFADEVRGTFLVREANLAVAFGRAGFAVLRAGRARYSVGDGLIYDDYGTGADLSLDLGAIGPPLEIRAQVFQPTRDMPRSLSGVSPLAVVRVDCLPSLFEHVGLFAAALRDRSGSVAELFRGAAVEDAVVRLSGLVPGTARFVTESRTMAATLSAPLGSTATLGWFGTSGSLTSLGQRFGFTAALLRGNIDSFTYAGATQDTNVGLSGKAVHLRWDATPADWITISPWLLYLSGDRPPPEKRRLGLPPGYAGFLGVAPFVTATNIFFGGGLSESFAARQVSAPGVNGRGVFAPGMEAVWGPGAEVEFTSRVAWLRAEDPGPFGGQTYGTEVDFELTSTPLPYLTVGLEQDLLFPGDFFGGAATISKTVLAVDLRTP
jgi:hypothetical protein